MGRNTHIFLFFKKMTKKTNFKKIENAYNSNTNKTLLEYQNPLFSLNPKKNHIPTKTLWIKINYCGLNITFKKLSKNQIRKFKRYNTKINYKFFISQFLRFRKKKIYSKHQQHLKIKLFNTPISFNSGYMNKLSNLKECDLKKISYLIENAINKNN